MILITDYIDAPSIEREILGASLKHFSDSDFTNDQIEQVLVWHQKVDEEFLNKYPNLNFVQRYGVGYDNIDLEQCANRGILFANNPDYGVEEVASTALSMILNLSRNINAYSAVASRQIQSQSDIWQETTLTSSKRLSESVLSIFGYGRIGQKLASYAKAIFKGIRIYDPYLTPGHEKILGVERVENFDNFLNDASILSIHSPLNEETRELINADFLHKLPNQALLVNTARGGIIDDLSDIHDSLKSGHLGGVALDVLPSEPPTPGDAFLKEFVEEFHFKGNVIINPHTAYYSQESYTEMRTKASLNIKRFKSGKEPYNLIQF